MTLINSPALTFQDLILRLHQFWSSKGCLIWQPYNQIVGAGTMNPATFLRVLGPEPWDVGYIEPSVRPDDGRFGENPNRLYTHTQYQVILKPTPENSQELYLESLAAIGIDPSKHDIRFVEDNWAQPAIGAWGLGWEVWLDGLEITQYTYFQQVGGITLDPIPLELTYGLERIAMALQGVKNVFDLKWDEKRTYGDVKLQDEIERSQYAYNQSDVEFLYEQFDAIEAECKRTVARGLVAPAHDFVLQLSNVFNLLDTRGAIGVTERQRFLGRTRDLARTVAAAYVKQREVMGHPWLKASAESKVLSPEVTQIPNSQNSELRTQNLLFEIGVEELPAHNVSEGKAQLEKWLPEILKEARLMHGSIRVLATPRRFAVLVNEVASQQSTLEELAKGPATKIAIGPDGKPTQAALGFAKKFGLGAEAIKVFDDGKQSYVYIERREEGKPAIEVLRSVLPNLIAKLSFEKTMRWNSSNVAFARPLQWYVALLGQHIIPFEYANITSGNISTGPRGEGSPRFMVDHADDYDRLLSAQHIIGDVATRRAEIQRQLATVAASIGAQVEADDDLLDEVTNLVEQPVALLAKFDPAYLEMPPIILTKVMRSKQRYFTLIDAKTGAMRPNFITVRNGPDRDNDLVVAGNENVVFARFADASYFYRHDQEKPLAEYVQKLELLTFQTQLGSMLDKTKRIESLVEAISVQLTMSPATAQTAKTAAHLCKADLVTSMVIEMTSLQGTMGRAYHLRQGGDEAVADAIAEHYWPRFAGDKVPQTPAGLVVALADKLDSIAGLFAVGLAPKGSADPFALRRAAIGVVQGLVQNGASFSLWAGLRSAAARLPIRMSNDALDAAHKFIVERHRAALVEAGYRHDVVDAVLSVQGDNPTRAQQAIEQLADAVKTAGWDKTLAAYARCARIVKNQPIEAATTVDSDPATVALAQAVAGLGASSNVETLIANLQNLVAPISHFFDKVMVNVDDAGLRLARQVLLWRIVAQAHGIADLSKLEGF